MKARKCPSCKNAYKPLFWGQPCPTCQVTIIENEPDYVPSGPRLPVDYDRSIHKGERIKKWRYNITRTFMKGKYR